MEIADAHTDLLLDLAHRPGAPWVQQLERGGVVLQVCPVFVTEGVEAAAQVAAFERLVRERADAVVQVRAGADLRGAGRRIALVLALEGAEPLGDGAAALDDWWSRGVRVVGLTWNPENAFAGGADTPGTGLKAAGSALVERLVELGGLVDLAHASPQTFGDVLALAPRGRVLVTHAGCRAVHDHPRNLDDAQLAALADHGGIIGIAAVGDILGEPSLNRWIEHVAHAVAAVGAEHVCLGSDFIDALARGGALSSGPRRLLARVRRHPAVVPGLAGPEDYPAAVAALERAGLADERILNGNLRRFLAKSLPGD